MYIELGPVPCGEKCEQLGSNYRPEFARFECQQYKAQLEREFNHLSDISFSIKSFPHDFGTYMEVVVRYDDENEESVDNAFHVDSNSPEKWDNLAKARLEIFRKDNARKDIF